MKDKCGNKKQVGERFSHCQNTRDLLRENWMVTVIICGLCLHMKLTACSKLSTSMYMLWNHVITENTRSPGNAEKYGCWLKPYKVLQLVLTGEPFWFLKSVKWFYRTTQKSSVSCQPNVSDVLRLRELLFQDLTPLFNQKFLELKGCRGPFCLCFQSSLKSLEHCVTDVVRSICCTPNQTWR